MRRIVVLLALALLLAPVLTAQDAQQQGGEQEQKPTLGPKPGPGESGPRTATVNDYRKLMRIRTLYIERMDNDLSEKLVASLGKLGRFKMATNAKEADAIVRGSCLESRRLKRLHTEVSITDRGGGSIWQDIIFRPYNPPSLAQAVIESAQMIAEHLGESINQAGMK
ncbi:MAG: hypothetical protein ABSH52_26480 [Terriglobia bacterium]|jgi:hypothetical protein